MDNTEIHDTSLKVVKRAKNGDYYNLYIRIGSYSFELVPHCRTMKEKALFYAVLKKNLMED